MNLQNFDIQKVHVLDAATITATTTYTSYVDLNGFESCAFVLTYKAGTADSSNYFTPAILEATASPTASGSYSAASAIVGAFTTIASTTGGTQIVFYNGVSRYVALRLAETGTASAVIGCVCILGNPKKGPARDITPTTGTIS